MAQSISNSSSPKWGYPSLSNLRNTPKPKVQFGIPNTSAKISPNFGTKTTTPATSKPPVPAMNLKPKNSGLVSSPITFTSGSVTPQNTRVSQPTGQTSTAPLGYQPPVQTNITADNKNNNTATKGLIDPLSFSGTIGSLIKASDTNSNQKKYLRLLEETAAGNKAIGEQARDISKMYADEIARVGGLGAGAVAGNLSTGTNVVGAGNAAIASQSASARMQALSDAQQAALQGTGQMLTGQEQMASAYSQGLGATNTQQAQQLSGLQNAANLMQPSPSAYGQTVFNPIMGGFAGGNMEPTMVAQQLANAVKSGQMTYEQAVQSMGYAGGAGQQFLNQALGANFNIPQTQAQLSGQTGVLSQLPMMEAADVAAEGIKNKIVTYLAANPSLNPSDAKLVNEFNAWIQGKQLTDPKFQTLFNYLNEYTNTLTPILGVGGDSTNLKTEIAASFINAKAGAASIAEVLNNISALSKGKVQDLRSGATGGGVQSSSVSPGLGGSSDDIFNW